MYWNIFIIACISRPCRFKTSFKFMNSGRDWRLEMIAVVIWVQLHSLLIGALVGVLAEIRGFYPSFCKLAQMCWWHIFHKAVSWLQHPPCSLALFVLYPPSLCLSLLIHLLSCKWLHSAFSVFLWIKCLLSTHNLLWFVLLWGFLSGFGTFVCICHYPKVNNKQF